MDGWMGGVAGGIAFSAHHNHRAVVRHPSAKYPESCGSDADRSLFFFPVLGRQLMDVYMGFFSIFVSIHLNFQ